jgi:hypothetical protein
MRNEMMVTNMSLNPTAPATPIRIAFLRTDSSRLRTASAMTTALSPESMRSMSRTPANRPSISAVKKSANVPQFAPRHRVQDLDCYRRTAQL